MAKKESTFLTELGHSFREQYPSCWFYKIPDAPSAARFMAKRPFDAFLTLGNIPIAIEAKALNKLSAINYNLLEEHQKEALEEFESYPGRHSFVFVNIRQRANVFEGIKQVNRLYIFNYLFLKEKGSILKKELDQYPYVSGKNKRFNLTSFVHKFKTL